MNKTFYFIFVFAILSNTFVFSQLNKIDSLQNFGKAQQKGHYSGSYFERNGNNMSLSRHEKDV